VAGTMMDEVANDLALWIDQTANDIALAFAPTRAPFAAQTTEAQKVEYYRQKLFNPDGSPNAQGRNEELQRLGVEGFGLVYKAIIRAHPELKIPTPAEIAVPNQWPTRAPSGPAGGPPGPPGAPPGPPGGSLPGPGAAGPPLAGPRMPVPPRPPMMPPPGVRPMASGGVVTEPTVALIGEQGPEAVVPLTNSQMPDPDLAARLGGQPSAPGLIAGGNIDLNTRPVVNNPDGSISTVRSISFEDENGREILVPTVSDDGRILTNQQAIDQYYDTGRHLGIFTSPEAATDYALRLHQQQERQYIPRRA